MTLTKTKISIRGILNAFVFVFILVNSGFALTTGHNVILVLSEIGLLAILLIGTRIRYLKTDNYLKALVIMMLSLVLTFIINTDIAYYRSYINSLLFIVNAYLIFKFFDTDRLMSFFLKLMLAVSIVCNAVCLINIFFPISSYFPVISNGYGVKYHTLGIINFQVGDAFLGSRCCGIFWEPGMFAGMLAITALLDICLSPKGKHRNLRLICYCLSIIFTYSTTGYIYIFLILLMLFALNTRRVVGVIFFAVIVLLAVLVCINFDMLISKLAVWMPDVFEKILHKNASYLTRVLSPLSDFITIAKNPLGVGLGNVESVRALQMSQLGIQTAITTSTLTYYGVVAGIPFLISYNYLWLKNFVSMRKSLMFRVFAIIIFAVVLTSNPMFGNQFIWILLFVPWEKQRPSVKE